LLKNSVISCVTVMIDRNKIGDFRMILIKKGDDLATWLHILKNGIVAFGISDVLTEVRIRKGSISYNKIKLIKDRWNIYRKVERFNILSSAYYFGFYIINFIKKRYNILEK